MSIGDIRWVLSVFFIVSFVVELRGMVVVVFGGTRVGEGWM